MKYEITVEDKRLIDIRPIAENNQFPGLCISFYEAYGMASGMRLLCGYLRKEGLNDINKTLIEINERYAQRLEQLAKQLGHPELQDEAENGCEC